MVYFREKVVSISGGGMVWENSYDSSGIWLPIFRWEQNAVTQQEDDAIHWLLIGKNIYWSFKACPSFSREKVRNLLMFLNEKWRNKSIAIFQDHKPTKTQCLTAENFPHRLMDRLICCWVDWLIACLFVGLLPCPPCNPAIDSLIKTFNISKN